MQEVRFQLPHISLTGLSNAQRGKPVLLGLHGWLDNAASFLPLAPYLDDFHFIALDFAGHGHSQHRGRDAHYHLTDYVQDLYALFQAQNWHNVVILGHSMGGIVATLFSSAFPEWVSKLICIESFGPISRKSSDVAEQLRQSVLSRYDEGRKSGKGAKPKATKSLEKLVQARLLAGEMSPKSASTLLQRNLQQTARGFEFRSDKRLKTASSQHVVENQAQSVLQQIQAPLLFIYGRDGYESVKTYFERRQAKVRTLETILLEGGHHLHMDFPAPVANSIVTFLCKKHVSDR